MERPFDTPLPTFVPTRPDQARGTLTRRMGLVVGRRINAERPKQDIAVLGRLCRLNNYLLRRERRMNAA